MNLDVEVRLRDDERGARRILDHFTRIADAAKRLSTGDASSTAVRGLSKAVSGLDGASRLSRLSAAVSGLARDAGAIEASAKALTGLSRSVSRLSAVSDHAEKAASGLGKLKSAMSGMPSDGGFVAGINAELRNMLDLQRRAAAGMRSLNSGGGRGRRGMAGGGNGGEERMPGIALALQPHSSPALRSVYEQATSLQDAIVKMHLNGLSDSEISAVRAKADEVAKLNKSTTPLANINAIMEARLALGGDLQEALTTAPEMSKLRTIAGFALGKDRAKGAEDGVYDMLRTGELRGVINDPARRASLFKGMTAAMIASNGRITPKQWHSTAIYGRSATQGFSDEFENNRLPFLMQELQGGGKGGQAGTALQALFRAIPLAITKQTNIAEWRRLGLIDESRIQKGAHGGERALPGAITIGKTAISDPDRAVFQLMDAMKAHGITERGEMIREFAQLIGTGTGQTAVDVLGLQRDRLENFSRTLKMVEDSDTLFAQINETASQSVERLDTSVKTLSGNIGSMVIPAFTSLVDATNRIVGAANGLAVTGGKNGNDPVNRPGANDGFNPAMTGLAIGGAMWTGLAFATRFPAVARFAGIAMGHGLVGVAGGPLASVLANGVIRSTVTVMGSAATTGMLGRILATVAAPEVGIAMGLAFAGAAAESFMRGLALRGLKGILDAIVPNSMKNSPQQIEQNNKGLYEEQKQMLANPNSGWFARRHAQVVIDELGPKYGPQAQGQPPKVAGQRALGGPVARGLSYLVGERGPEMFTPGSNGSVLTNSYLNSSAAMGEDGMEALGSTLAQAIRYQTFALATAIRDLRERHGYGAGSSGPGGYGSNGSGSSGSGGGGYGRGSGGSTGDGGAVGSPAGPMGRAGLSDNASVASAAKAFGLGGWRSLTSGRGRFMAGTRAGRLGIGSVDSMGFQPMGVAGATNERLAAQRAGLFAELDRDPQLRRDVIKTASMESGGGPGQVIEAMANRAAMNHWTSFRQVLGLNNPSKSFFGPIRAGRLRGALSEPDRRRGEAGINEVRRGSNAIQYRTDQGMPSDPGGRRYMAEGGDFSGRLKVGGEHYWYMGPAGRRWATQQSALDRTFKPSGGSMGAFGVGGFNLPSGPTVPGSSTRTPATGGGGGTSGIGDKPVAAGAISAGLSRLRDQMISSGAIDRITATNDAFHHKLAEKMHHWSKHTMGLAMDAVGNPDSIIAQYRERMAKAGLKEKQDYYIQDEYRHPSPFSTGKHVHFQFQNSEAAERYAKSQPQAQMPDALAERSRVEAERRREHRAALQSGGGKHGTVVHVGGINVHPGPGHDPQHIADAVHQKFNAAVERQLSDGAYA